MKKMIVIGNGPSLKLIDLTKLTDHSTIGLNGGFRYYNQINWFPKLYGFLDDDRIRPWSYDEINEFVSLGKCDQYYFYEYEKEHITDQSKCTFINTKEPVKFSFNPNKFSLPWQLDYQSLKSKLPVEKHDDLWSCMRDSEEAKKWLTEDGIIKLMESGVVDKSLYHVKPKFDMMNILPKSFKDFYSIQGGNAGLMACKVCKVLGADKVILIGMDCNYVDTGKYLDSKQNHVIDDYYPDGVWDTTQWSQKYANGGFAPRFNVIQLHQWQTFKDILDFNGSQLDIVNCTEGSKLESFRQAVLEDEL
jgi:hypothetical protein